MKVVQIDGFRGIITALFIGACLFAGFVVFPGMVAMSLWNKYLASLFMFPVLNILQGVLLWGIIAITYCILSKKGLAISFKDGPSLSEAEFDTIMRKAKINSQIKKINTVIQKADKFEKSKIESEKDLTHVSTPISLNKDITSEKEDETISNVK